MKGKVSIYIMQMDRAQ